MITFSKAAAALAFSALVLAGASSAQAQTCLEQIVALQSQIPQSQIDAIMNAVPSQPQTIGAQTDRQPTPGSVAAAEGGRPELSGAVAALNKAQNLQAAGDREGCLKAVEEARKLLEKK